MELIDKILETKVLFDRLYIKYKSTNPDNIEFSRVRAFKERIDKINLYEKSSSYLEEVYYDINFYTGRLSVLVYDKVDTGINIINLDMYHGKLTGKKHGSEIFNINIKNNIDFTKINILKFSDELDIITVSFINGFCDELFKYVARHEFGNVFIIEATKKVKDRFEKSIAIKETA